jgi:hypothetical protein
MRRRMRREGVLVLGEIDEESDDEEEEVEEEKA